MSVQAMAAVMEGSTMTGKQYLVLLVVANHEGDKDGELWAWPSIDTLAREARCVRRTVVDAIAKAEELGELLVERNAGPRGVNLYRVLLGKAGANPALPQTGDSAGRTVQTGGASLHPNVRNGGSRPSSVVPAHRDSDVLGATRPRDRLFEVLTTVQTGTEYGRTPLTAKERSKVNAAAKDLRDAGYTGEDAERAITAWPRAMGDARITANGLAANFARCLSAANGVEFQRRDGSAIDTIARARQLVHEGGHDDNDA